MSVRLFSTLFRFHVISKQVVTTRSFKILSVNLVRVSRPANFQVTLIRQRSDETRKSDEKKISNDRTDEDEAMENRDLGDEAHRPTSEDASLNTQNIVGTASRLSEKQNSNYPGINNPPKTANENDVKQGKAAAAHYGGVNIDKINFDNNQELPKMPEDVQRGTDLPKPGGINDIKQGGNLSGGYGGSDIQNGTPDTEKSKSDKIYPGNEKPNPAGIDDVKQGSRNMNENTRDSSTDLADAVKILSSKTINKMKEFSDDVSSAFSGDKKSASITDSIKEGIKNVANKIKNDDAAKNKS